MIDGWREEYGYIEKKYFFELYITGAIFAMKVAELAQYADHHPDILITYKKVTVTTSTHDAGDTVTEKDLSLARQVNELYEDLEGK